MACTRGHPVAIRFGKSGKGMSGPCSASSLATLTRPRRAHFLQAMSICFSPTAATSDRTHAPFFGIPRPSKLLTRYRARTASGGQLVLFIGPTKGGGFKVRRPVAIFWPMPNRATSWSRGSRAAAASRYLKSQRQRVGQSCAKCAASGCDEPKPLSLNRQGDHRTYSIASSRRCGSLLRATRGGLREREQLLGLRAQKCPARGNNCP